MQVLEDQCVFPGAVASPGAAVTDIVTNHSLQLERDVLDDVGAVSTTLQANDEPARLTDAAAMIPETGHRRQERLRQAGDVGGGDVLVGADGQIHSGYRQPRPVVRSAGGMERRHPDFRFRIWKAVSHYLTCSSTRESCRASR